MRALFVCTGLLLLSVNALWAAPLDGSWETRLLLILDGPQPKIAQTPFALDSLLRLTLTVSGFQITSLTALSTVGVEAQVFKLSAKVGALTLTDILLFSRNIVEVEHQYYQITFVRPDPGGIVGQYIPIFYKDLVTPYAALARLLGPTLTDAVILRKKIVETQFSIAGVTVKTVALFANFGSALVPQWEVGAILTASGQTVSGVTVRSETYIGARRGFECVGECLPELQFTHGRVVAGLNVEYERLIITSVKLAGMTVNVDTAFNVNDREGPVGIEYLQITSSARVEPLALDLTDILYFDSNLEPSSHTLIMSWSVGDLFVTAIWTDTLGGIVFSLREFTTSFSVGGVSITSDLFVCAADAGCFGLDPIYQHDVQILFKNGPWTADLLLVFLGLIKPLDKAVLTVSYADARWGWRAGTAIQPSGLKVQEFFINLRF
uniref:Uncharacterized protein n=1 Tax=Acetithermum autotrophicum TaxID=1446466 RepID=H5SSM2_ACEAU|nr:hypothetical protein HGMM_OP3C313 [Candidatus Acetothermum autotrophicum]